LALANGAKLITSTFGKGDVGSVIINARDRVSKGSEFTLTRRGGLPPSPNQPLSTDVVWSDTRTSAITAQQQARKIPAAKPPSKAEVVEIVPATGWVFDGKGQVTLISHASNANGLRSTPTSCPKQ
jgi:large exoprotein involved in heme utilization and adhesion